jgi:fumarate reductase subunit D
MRHTLNHHHESAEHVEATRSPNIIVKILLPFLLVLLLSKLVAPVGLLSTDAVRKYGSVELAASLGVVVMLGVCALPFYGIYCAYRQGQRLCRLGWELAQQA